MGEAWQRFRKDKAALFGAAVIVAVVTAAILAPWVTPYDPSEQFFDGLTLEARRCRRTGVSGWVPISSGATSTPGSSTARGPRSSSASSPTRWRC